jgi:hypothetical protein
LKPRGCLCILGMGAFLPIAYPSKHLFACTARGGGWRRGGACQGKGKGWRSQEGEKQAGRHHAAGPENQEGVPCSHGRHSHPRRADREQPWLGLGLQRSDPGQAQVAAPPGPNPPITYTSMEQNKRDLQVQLHMAMCTYYVCWAAHEVSAISTDFIRTFLITESKDLKGVFGAEHLLVQLEKFLEVEPLVTELGKYHKRVLAMHAATSKF